MGACKGIRDWTSPSVLLRRSPRQKPEAEFHIYGDGNMKPERQALARELGLKEKILFFESLPARQIAQVVANADLGIVPKRADSFGNEAYSTKIMEFMSLGRARWLCPARRLTGIILTIRWCGFLNQETRTRWPRRCWRCQTIRNSVARMAACASQYVIRNSWQSRKGDYLQLVDSLISPAARD